MRKIEIDLAMKGLHEQETALLGGISDQIPADMIESFLAYQLADGNLVSWRDIESTMTEVEITIGYAFRRCQLYLAKTTQ